MIIFIKFNKTEKVFETVRLEFTDACPERAIGVAGKDGEEVLIGESTVREMHQRFEKVKRD